MAKINMQFHALPKEVIEFAEICAKDHKLHSVAIGFFPDFKVYIIENYKALIEPEKIDRICLCLTKPDISVTDAIEFSKRNPDCLSLSIGKYDDEGLVESGLGANTENKIALKIWRILVRRLKAITLEGAWVVNQHTGAKEYYKNHRYTATAEQLSETGVKIKPLAGWNSFILKDTGSP